MTFENPSRGANHGRRLLSRLRDYPAYILFVFILYGPILLLTVLTHEMGHVMMNKKCGGETGGIYLWPLGGFGERPGRAVVLALVRLMRTRFVEIAQPFADRRTT